MWPRSTVQQSSRDESADNAIGFFLLFRPRELSVPFSKHVDVLFIAVLYEEKITLNMQKRTRRVFAGPERVQNHIIVIILSPSLPLNVIKCPTAKREQIFKKKNSSVDITILYDNI